MLLTSQYPDTRADTASRCDPHRSLCSSYLFRRRAPSVATSDVRLQWDPDHDPAGRPLERRAIQLGLRGNALHRYGTTELVSMTDITDFVIEQRDHLRDGFKRLLVPYEQVYRPEATARNSVGIS